MMTIQTSITSKRTQHCLPFRTLIVATVLVAATAASAVCPFKPDTRGLPGGTATTDGLLFLRYALGANATQSGTLPATVAAYIAANKTALDMDGDTLFTAFDAQIIARYLFGFRNDALTNGLATMPSVKRFGSLALKNYIDAGCTGATDKDQQAVIFGYLNLAHNSAAQSYNAGYSMYIAAWPLLTKYPGNRFNSGLPSTWMWSQYPEGNPPGLGDPSVLYSDIEGGLGWWEDTRFATETPKFIMGGVALNFSEWANGPGAGQGRDWNAPKGKYGVAQLSPWVMFPPDGLNVKQGTSGELFGYGYLPLPLTEPKLTTAGAPVKTGNHSWTLFLNTANFKGPVAFFTPYFFSQKSVARPDLNGTFLDSRFSNPNKGLQMETHYIPSFQSVDAKGDTYARIAPISFPRDGNGDSVIAHALTVYNQSALWGPMNTWFGGGAAVGAAAASAVINASGSTQQSFTSSAIQQGGWTSSWSIFTAGTLEQNKVPISWNSFATPTAISASTFGYRWNAASVSTRPSSTGLLVALPEYFRSVKNSNGSSQWAVVQATDVPTETGLTALEFKRATRGTIAPYVTPDDALSSWKKPGPVAGPFQANLGDGSTVTYYWYRFADQPALLNADLTSAEREAMQLRVEKLHRLWTKEREYLAPPTTGTLASVDPALIVTPPAGFEVGYVPIITRQASTQ